MERHFMSLVQRKFRNLDLKNRLNIVYSARKGVKPKIFYSFADVAKMTERSLALLLHLHPRTIQNYREQQKNLDPVESEHLLKLIALFVKGEELFGNIDELNYWLQKRYWDNSERPMDLLTTPGGVDLVSDELDRLAQGYPI